MTKKARWGLFNTISVIWPYVVFSVLIIVLSLAGLRYTEQMLSGNADTVIKAKFADISDKIYENVTQNERICDVLASSGEVALFPYLDAEERSVRTSYIKQEIENVPPRRDSAALRR